jgi:hypothetical protein
MTYRMVRSIHTPHGGSDRPSSWITLRLRFNLPQPGVSIIRAALHRQRCRLPPTSPTRTAPCCRPKSGSDRHDDRIEIQARAATVIFLGWFVAHCTSAAPRLRSERLERASRNMTEPSSINNPISPVFNHLPTKKPDTIIASTVAVQIAASQRRAASAAPT